MELERDVMITSTWYRRAWIGLALLLCSALPAFGNTRDVRIPLKNGTLHVADLSAAVCNVMDLPSLHLGHGDLKINSVEGRLFVEAVNVSLASAGHIKVESAAVVLTVDLDRLASRCDNMSRAVRVLATEANPKAAAAQAARWGLFMPAQVDPSRPLVVLVHGLDSDRGTLQPMAQLLDHDGQQVACFCYAGDQPIEDSADILGAQLRALHQKYPAMKIDLVAHSMGGLVARDYVEGSAYTGGIDHLILVATPNAGSSWARLRCLLSIQEHYRLWRSDPAWSPMWWFTEGFGEAGRELTPGSPFLKKMESLQRRPDVRYTVIVGTQSITSRFSAECLDDASGWIGGRVAKWWGFRQIKNGLSHEASHFRSSTSASDGLVSVESATLPGTHDVVRIQADHVALFIPVDGKAPAAYGVIRQRLRS